MSKKIHVRPGKGQSKAGFVVGILFCLLGIFMVIPVFGLFGVVWTALAGWITYVNYRNGFTNRPISNKVIEIEDDGKDMTVVSRGGFETHSFVVEEEASDKGTVEERLKKLQSLYDQALITEEEYERKRQEILEEL